MCCGFRLPHSERFDRNRGRGNSVVQRTVGAWLVSVVVKRFSRAGYDSGLESTCVGNLFPFVRLFYFRRRGLGGSFSIYGIAFDII